MDAYTEAKRFLVEQDEPVEAMQLLTNLLARIKNGHDVLEEMTDDFEDALKSSGQFQAFSRGTSILSALNGTLSSLNKAFGEIKAGYEEMKKGYEAGAKDLTPEE